MSRSAFHQHFRAATSLTPLQFQKQLRLIEARRLMLSQGMTASNAAFAVGYQSASQFTNDYRRTFGLPPLRETAAARSRAKIGRASTKSDVRYLASHRSRATERGVSTAIPPAMISNIALASNVAR